VGDRARSVSPGRTRPSGPVGRVELLRRRRGARTRSGGRRRRHVCSPTEYTQRQSDDARAPVRLCRWLGVIALARCRRDGRDRQGRLAGSSSSGGEGGHGSSPRISPGLADPLSGVDSTKLERFDPPRPALASRKRLEPAVERQGISKVFEKLRHLFPSLALCEFVADTPEQRQVDFAHLQSRSSSSTDSRIFGLSQPSSTWPSPETAEADDRRIDENRWRYRRCRRLSSRRARAWPAESAATMARAPRRRRDAGSQTQPCSLCQADGS
jgi:hypothetical protein